jgi:hypothetical protein
MIEPLLASNDQALWSILSPILRRWIIRSVTVALCALCAGIWVFSYFQEVWLEHIGPKGNVLFRILPGSLDFDDLRSSRFNGMNGLGTTVGLEWHFLNGIIIPSITTSWDSPTSGR